MLKWRRRDALRTAGGLLLVCIVLWIGFVIFMVRSAWVVGLVLGFHVPAWLNPFGPDWPMVMAVTTAGGLAGDVIELAGLGLALSMPSATGGRILIWGAIFLTVPAVVLEAVEMNNLLVELGAIAQLIPVPDGIREQHMWFSICSSALFVIAIKRLAQWLGEPHLARKAVRDLLLMMLIVSLLYVMFIFRLVPRPFLGLAILGHCFLILVVVIRYGYLLVSMRRACLNALPYCPEEIDEVFGIHEEY